MNVLRLTSLIGAVMAAACGRSPVSPSPTVPATRSVGGAWSGSYVPICPGAPNCASVVQGPSGAQPLSLSLTQQGEAVSGQINLGGWLPRAANVTGTIAPSGVMTLQGGDSWPALSFCRPAGGWSIHIWNARYDPQSDLISGDFEFVTQKHLSSCYYTDLRVNAANVVLRHGEIPTDSAMAGHWQGRMPFQIARRWAGSRARRRHRKLTQRSIWSCPRAATHCPAPSSVWAGGTARRCQ